MSLKGLFDTVAVTKIVDNKTPAEIGRVVESADYHEADIVDEKRFVPRIDFSKPENFAKYGSAQQYYEDSFNYIYSSYPYDGSLAEKVQWKNSGSYVDLYIFDHQYPRTTGYVNLSYGGWGTAADAPGAANNGYGRPSTLEYISLNGGPGLGGGIQSQSANVWDPANNRESNLEVDPTEGVTVEFWLKKDTFDNSKTSKEVVFDVWNNELSSSTDYGRLRIELTGAAAGNPTWLVTLMSGTSGFQAQSIGTTTVSDISDGAWHHYGFSFLSASTGVTSKYYVDGGLNTTTTLGSTGVDKVGGSMQALMGALITPLSGDVYHGVNMTGSGKLSASVDEFRYWKTQRSSEKIGRYWFSQVGGGTNTDLANTDLGVYYKFNEGITGTPSTDSVVLDYSGRVTNGAWTGYSAGARNTGSAMVSSSATSFEFRDPIIYPTHPDVVTKLASLKLSGSVHDYENPSELFSFFPSWMQEQDPREGNELKKLTQILSSYFDTLYLQIEAFGNVHDHEYLSGSATRASTMGEHLLASRGLLAPELFLDADILEKLGDRSETLLYEDTLTNVKNKIYQNIYNNLISIYKSKGTRQSFRNLLRCFGIDEKIYKLNVYGNNVQYEVRDNRDLYSANKRFADFSEVTRFESTVFLTSSAANTNSVSYISSSTALTGGFASTLETYVTFPGKPTSYENAYENFKFDHLTSSLFGQHTVRALDPDSLTWESPDGTNFQVYAVRPEVGSPNARFMLSSSEGGFMGSTVLTSSYYDDVYANSNWVFGVTLKPEKYPLPDYILGSSTTLNASTSYYTVEFKGAHVEAGEVLDSFILSSSLYVAGASGDPIGYGFLTGSKRVYVGAHRQDFEGTTLQRADTRIGFCRYWLDDISLTTIENHAKDVTGHGAPSPSRAAYLFEGNQALNSGILQTDTLALNWDFETVTGSSAAGTFSVPDFSSGSSVAQSSQFGFLGDILKAQHTGYGYGFPVSTTASVSADYVLAAELLDIERLTSMDMISVLNEADDVEFTRESRPINYLYAIEKSMNQSISEEMLKMFSAVVDFNNLVGEPTSKYRTRYKKMRTLRQRFFEKVGNTPDLDKYIEYYKWFDSALSKIIQQLIPASAEFSPDIRTIVESHVLERNKYQHKFPTIDLKSETYVGTISSPLPLSPGWQYTHAPINGLQSTNANWWKTRARRDSGLLASADAAVNNDRQRTFDDSLRDQLARKRNHVFRFEEALTLNIKAGNNPHTSKEQGFVYGATAPYGPMVPSTNIPQNIMVSFDSDVYGLQDITDNLYPTQNRRMGFGMNPNINKDSDVRMNGNLIAPFSLYSSSVAGGYNAQVQTEFTSSVMVTNLHEDVVTVATRPLQGPFTEKFVGGRQYRHTEINSGSDTRFSRAEGFRIELGVLAGTSYVGALGVVPPNYPFGDSPSGSAPDGFLPAVPVAPRLRDEAAKRPVNIKNILMTSSDIGVRLSGTIIHNRIGNYTKNYQIVQTAGRWSNDLYFQRQSFDFASNPLASNQTIRGRFPLCPHADATPNVGFTEYELPNRDGVNSNQTIFVNRFNAPGSYNASSKGYMDPAHEEKSVYNVLPYRNLSVLNYGTFVSSSKDSSIQLAVHAAETYVGYSDAEIDRGLRQRLTVHNKAFGYDSSYPTLPAYYKVNRNPRKIFLNTTTTSSQYDNWYIHHPIPRSEQQYRWITASLAPNSVIYGYSQLSGGYFVESLPLVSRSADYADEPFVYLNIGLIDPVSASTNTLGLPLSTPTASYINPDFWAPPVFDNNEDMFNTLMLVRNGPYQAPSWKQVRYSDHPVLRNHKKNSILSARILTNTDLSYGRQKGSALKQFVEPQVYSSEMPMVHQFRVGGSRVELKSSFGNKLLDFANYELNNLLGVKKRYDSADIYFNRVNSMILKKTNRDKYLQDNISDISAIYAQTVYPAAYNAFLGRTFMRTAYSIDDIWNDRRDKRSVKALINSQGTTIDKNVYHYPSVWPADAHLNYSSSVSTTYDDGAGELQNSYSRYIVHSTPLKNEYTIIPAATYNARFILGEIPLTVTITSSAIVGDRYNLVAGSFSGSLGAAGSGKQPYKRYEQYCKDLKLAGKDYSIVPEFRISEHISDYLENGQDFTTLNDIEDLLDLTGSAYVNSSEDGFFKEYANSDFMKLFDIVNSTYQNAELVDGSQMSQNSLGLRCNALLQFLPYKGFYPAERTLELASLFSQSYGSYVVKSGSSAAYGATYRAILEPLYSQGVMYNTIKSGIAVSNFIISQTASVIASDIKPKWGGPPGSSISASAVHSHATSSLPEGNLYFDTMLPPFRTTDGSFSGSTGYPLWNENGYFYQKIPFEALYNPRTHLTEDYIDYSGKIYDTGLSSASLEELTNGISADNYVTWNGEGDKRYDLAIDNFLCETVNFFQNGLTSIVSGREDDFGATESGSVYTMKMKLYRPTMTNPSGTSIEGGWGDDNGLIPDYDKFDMYRRISAFGPPMASLHGPSTVIAGGLSPLGASASFSHLTPPYFAGSGSCTFIYTASANRSPTLDEIFAGTTIEYDRMEIVPLANGPVTDGTKTDMSSYMVQMNDSFNLTQSISTVPANTRTQKKQWLIQSKFETPIINIAGDRRTCGTDQVVGAFATGKVALTSSVLSSANASGFIMLTGSLITPAGVATGSIKFTGAATTTGVFAFTASSGTGYTFIADTGATRVHSGYAETNNVWYFNNSSGADENAEQLRDAITSSAFVVTDGGSVTMPASDAIMLTASVAGAAGNFDLEEPKSLGEAVILGMGGGTAQTASLTEDDRWVISDGGTDGGSAATMTIALTASGGSCPGGAVCFEIPSDLTDLTTLGTLIGNHINTQTAVTVGAEVATANKNELRITLTNDITGTAGNVAITDTTSSNGNGFQQASGMASGSNAVYSLVTMDRFTLGGIAPDGSTTSATFKLKDGASAADEAELVAWNASSSAANLVAKINAYPNMGVTAVQAAGSAANALITLTSDTTGSDSNITMVPTVTNSGYWDVSGMAGGVTFVAANLYGSVYGALPVATPSGTILPPDSTQTENCQIFTQGLWHDYGVVPSGSDEGVFAVIESPSPKEGKSLASLVGMPTGQPFRVGAVKDGASLEEAVVAVPFFVAKDGRRKFYKIGDDSPDSLESLRGSLEKYIFPPRFDFNRNKTMAPIAMYVFEFSLAVTQKDIADMWQNLPPAIHETFSRQIVEIEHPLLQDHMINDTNRLLRRDLRWLVFKVKRRAEMDYTRFAKKDLVGDINLVPSNIQNSPYSYNWPYDYFSLVELIKIDEAIKYTSELPPDSRIEIVGDVNIRSADGITLSTEDN